PARHTTWCGGRREGAVRHATRTGAIAARQGRPARKRARSLPSFSQTAQDLGPAGRRAPGDGTRGPPRRRPARHVAYPLHHEIVLPAREREGEAVAVPHEGRHLHAGAEGRVPRGWSFV